MSLQYHFIQSMPWLRRYLCSKSEKEGGAPPRDEAKAALPGDEAELVLLNTCKQSIILNT
jgi:hypothetical protein